MKRSLPFVLLFLVCYTHLLAQHVDTSLYAILLHDSSIVQYGIFPKDYRIAVANRQDVDNAEQLVINCIKEYNLKKHKEYDVRHNKDSSIKLSWFIIDLKKYKRQYIATISPKGEKIIWVNFFCSDAPIDADNRDHVLDVSDGGKCFFNLKIDLNKNKYYDLQVNGEA